MKTNKFSSIVLKSSFLIFSLLFFQSCLKEAPLGSRDNPIKLYFTPSVDSDTITSSSVELISYLEEKTGYYFKTGIPTNYVAVVEAFGSNRADIAVMNSFGYLMANSKYGAEAYLKSIRHGRDYYRGQIITHVDSGINSLKDLEGKDFAFTDASSTSGYLFPLYLLEKDKVHLGNKVFAIKHDNVVTMVYQKQVDGGATFYSAPHDGEEMPRDARVRVMTQFPDVLEKVKILAITEKIPNDPFVFRKDLPSEVRTKFIDALKSFIATDKGREIFTTIYSISGVRDAVDKEYDGLRAMVKSINVDIEKMLK